MTSATRRLSLAMWSIAVVVAFGWWPLSHRYGAGFVATNPFQEQTPAGIAVLAGMGKVITYISWESRFSRHGAFFEPVMAHEFPHPRFGFQLEGGRLWFSFPAGLVAILTGAAAWWHLRGTWSFRHRRPDPVEPST